MTVQKYDDHIIEAINVALKPVKRIKKNYRVYILVFIQMMI